MKRKVLIVIALSLTATVSNAGLLLGYFIGRASGLNSRNVQTPAEEPKQTERVAADTKYDVIACEKHTEKGICFTRLDYGSYSIKYLEESPDAYTKRAGYSKLHKASTHIVGTRRYIVMEVSN